MIFAVLLIFSAVVMLVQRSSDSGPKMNSRATYPVAMGASVFAGGLVGLLGVGGGIVKVPILQLLIGKSVKQALATSTMMVDATCWSLRRTKRSAPRITSAKSTWSQARPVR